jgi:hypothetical protein
MVNSANDAFEEDARFFSKRIRDISREINSRPELEEATGLLGPAAIRRRDYVLGQITKIVIRFRDDAIVDQTAIPSRKKRRERLDRMARAARILGQTWNELGEPDRLNLWFCGGRAFDEMLHAMEEAGVDIGDFLRFLEGAATAAATDMPGQLGGAPKALATEHLAHLCLRLYCEFREDGRSPGATRGGYPAFLRLVHELATDEEASLEAAAKTAYRAMRDGAGIFRIQVKDRT